MFSENETENMIMIEAPIKAIDKTSKTMNSDEDLLESLSWAGRLFFAGAAAFILGKGMQKLKLPIKVRGRPDQMRAVVDAIASSKRFQQELNRPNATIDGVIDKLQLRNLTKSKFREITGKSWPI